MLLLLLAGLASRGVVGLTLVPPTNGHSLSGASNGLIIPTTSG